ncbi:MAG TPA: hypothetical protein VF788_15905 [Pseudonocardiaceae bacterium]
MGVPHVGHAEGTDGFTRSTLLLARSLVLAAVLVVGSGARVTLAPSLRDAD